MITYLLLRVARGVILLAGVHAYFKTFSLIISDYEGERSREVKMRIGVGWLTAMAAIIGSQLIP
jgi:hypothetical protein